MPPSNLTPPTKTDDATPVSTAGELSLQISRQDASFNVSVGGIVWLEGLSPALHLDGAWFQPQRAGPPLPEPTVSTGRDGIGPFSAESYRLRAGSTGREVIATFRKYTTGKTVVFGLQVRVRAGTAHCVDFNFLSIRD